MIDLPQRRQFSSRDEFAAAVTASFHELFTHYDVEPVLHVAPEWVNNTGVHSVALPIPVAREGGATFGISNIIKHSIEMKKSAIGRLARVERDGFWIVYFEAK
jgi:hypothetical protein